MQWSSGQNGGFSRAKVDDLYHPVITDGPFGCHDVNVADQWADADSLLNWTTRLIRVRREARAIGVGKWHLLDVANPAVLGLRFDHDEEVVMTFHNLSEHEQTMEIPTGGGMVGRHPVFADSDYRSALDDGTEVTLDPFGYLWLRGRVPDTRLPH